LEYFIGLYRSFVTSFIYQTRNTDKSNSHLSSASTNYTHWNCNPKICDWGKQITQCLFLLSSESRIWNSTQNSVILPNGRQTEPIPFSLFYDSLLYILVYKNKAEITKQSFVPI